MDIVLSEDPTVPLLSINLKDAPRCNKDTCSTVFTAVIFIIARSWKGPRCPSIEEWIQKMWYIFIMKYYTARGRIGYGRRWRRCTEGQEIEQSCVAKGDGELGAATRMSQFPGKQVPPRIP